MVLPAKIRPTIFAGRIFIFIRKISTEYKCGSNVTEGNDRTEEQSLNGAEYSCNNVTGKQISESICETDTRDQSHYVTDNNKVNRINRRVCGGGESQRASDKGADQLQKRLLHTESLTENSQNSEKTADKSRHQRLRKGTGSKENGKSPRHQSISQDQRNNAVILEISKNSIASEQVKNEIDRAFSRLSEGMRIIPFIMDDSKLDDECAYYLCRQEFFFGNRPPQDMRIKELAQTIKEMLC